MPIPTPIPTTLGLNPLQRLYQEICARWKGHPSLSFGPSWNAWDACIETSPLFKEEDPSVVALSRSFQMQGRHTGRKGPGDRVRDRDRDLCVTPALVRKHWGTREWDLRLLSRTWTHDSRAVMQCAAVWRIENWWKKLTTTRDALFAWAAVDERENAPEHSLLPS